MLAIGPCGDSMKHAMHMTLARLRGESSASRGAAGRDGAVEGNPGERHQRRKGIEPAETPTMTRRGLNGIAVACGIMLLAGVAWADRAAVEKKVQTAKITLNLAEMPVDAALDFVSTLSGIAIRKTDMPKDVPRLTLNLKDVTVLDTLKYVTALTGFSWVIVDDGITISGKKAN